MTTQDWFLKLNYSRLGVTIILTTGVMLGAFGGWWILPFPTVGLVFAYLIDKRNIK